MIVAGFREAALLRSQGDAARGRRPEPYRSAKGPVGDGNCGGRPLVMLSFTDCEFCSGLNAGEFFPVRVWGPAARTRRAIRLEQRCGAAESLVAIAETCRDRA